MIEDEFLNRIVEQNEIDPEELDHLIQMLKSFNSTRHNSGESISDCVPESAYRMVCLTLLTCPHDLEPDSRPITNYEDFYNLLASHSSDPLPEVNMCCNWIALQIGKFSDQDIENLVLKAQIPLWDPIQALLLRALAFLGLRKQIGELIPHEGPTALFQADAMLEAVLPEQTFLQWANRTATLSDPLLPEEINSHWQNLIQAEIELLSGKNLVIVESALKKIACLSICENAKTYAEFELRRIVTRAVAAIIRTWISHQGAGDPDFLAGPIGNLLPKWEYNYLQSLLCWRENDLSSASSFIKSAFSQNTFQSAVRLAMAFFIARESPEKALNILESDNTTLENDVSRAVLLCRLEKYEEADRIISNNSNFAQKIFEPVRFRWSSGQKQNCKAYFTLQTALFEKLQDWTKASNVWNLAYQDNRSKAIHTARQFFTSTQELKSLKPEQRWRRSILKQKIKKYSYEIGNTLLTKNALFFRAYASIDLDSERSKRDFKILINRIDWINAERRVGGNRLILAGDALLFHGQTKEALKAYDWAKTANNVHLRDRSGVAKIYHEIKAGAKPDALKKTVEQLSDGYPDSEWIKLLSSYALFISGDIDGALLQINSYDYSEAITPIRNLLMNLYKSSGAPDPGSKMDLTDLGISNESKELLNLLWGNEPAAKQIVAFMNFFGDEWAAYYPFDPRTAAYKVVNEYFKSGSTDKSNQLLKKLEHTNAEWALEPANLIRLRSFIQRAIKGDLNAAEAGLTKMKVTHQKGGNDQ